MLAVLPMPVFGGPHRTFIRLARPLAQLGWETRVVLPDERGNAAERFRAAGIEPVTLPLHRPRAVRALGPHKAFARHLPSEVRALREVIERERTDVVVVVGPENIHGLLGARSAGVPAVCQLVGTWLPQPLRGPAMLVVSRLAEVVLSVGRIVAAEHPGAGHLGGRLMTFIPPVDLDVFAPPDAERRALARRELGLRQDDLVVGNVSNINPQKDHLNFVRAAALVRRARPETRFVILGSTHDTRPEVPRAVFAEADAHGMRLGQELIVRDPGPRVAELAAAFDLFWMTSGPKGEGVPTVLGEAMGLGLPVVATDVAGVGEVVAAPQTGMLVPPQDPGALAAATLPLLADPDRRRALGEAGRRRALAVCRPEAAADVHVRAFRLALARRQRRRAG